MTAAGRDQQLMVFGAVVYNSYGARLRHRSPHVSEYAEEKRTEREI